MGRGQGLEHMSDLIIHLSRPPTPAPEGFVTWWFWKAAVFAHFPPPTPTSVPPAWQAYPELPVPLLPELHSKWVGRTSCDLKILQHYLGVPSENLNTVEEMSLRKLKFSQESKLPHSLFPLSFAGSVTFPRAMWLRLVLE